MNTRKLSHIIKVASGELPADIVIRNCRIVDPISQTISEGSIAVYGGFIVGIGDYHGEKEIDGEGRYAVSGFIDAHVHIESAMCTPEAYGEMVIPLGTTTVVADPHEIANVKGIDGLQFMINSARRSPLKAHFMVPSCVPAVDFENSGAVLDSESIESLLGEKSILGLGEMMNGPGVYGTQEQVLEKLSAAINAGKPIDGHAPGLSGKLLNAYRVGGITTDHECTTPEEVRARLKRGMYVLLRQGSAAQDLEKLLPAVTQANSRRCAFCSDDKHAGDILRHGHINHNVKIAVKAGVDVFSAIAMATINAAECYRLKNTGLIAPGYLADIVLFDDLENFDAQMVFINGQLVAQGGKALFPVSNRVDKAVTHSVNIAPVTEKMLQVPLKTSQAKVISLHSHSLVTDCVTRTVAVKNGAFAFDSVVPVQKLVVVERHRATGKIGCALIENYGVTEGAVATTVAHDSHNLVVAGDNDRDILLALQELEHQGGGLTLVHRGKVVDTVALPIAGIMSDTSAFEVSKGVDHLTELAHNLLGINRNIDPFMSLSFLCLPVIPHIKLTPEGLFNVDSFSFTDCNG